MQRRQACRRHPLVLMAKFGVVVVRVDDSPRPGCDGYAVLELAPAELRRATCCTIMSMMSENLMPSACEVDVTGTVAMYALQLASGVPSALVDWNNNYGDDPNKCVFFHCGNWAKTYLPDIRDQHSADSRERPGRRKHLWSARGSHSRRTAGDLRARLDRRSPRTNRFLCR